MYKTRTLCEFLNCIHLRNRFKLSGSKKKKEREHCVISRITQTCMNEDSHAMPTEQQGPRHVQSNAFDLSLTDKARTAEQASSYTKTTMRYHIRVVPTSPTA